MPFTAALQAEYVRLYDLAILRPDWLGQIDHICNLAMINRRRYEAVSTTVNKSIDSGPKPIPWWWIAAIHSREASMSFARHLHNGDSLLKRTVDVPAGRPEKGEPPFTWEESAIDALLYEHLERWDYWNLSGALYKFEAYNGFGYRQHHAMFPPYLWSGTTIYSKGKYVSDGKFDPQKVDGQVGCAAIVKRLEQIGAIAIPR